MFVYIEVLRPSQPNGVMSRMVSLPNHTFVCLCWDFMAQSTQEGHVERGQFT